MFEPTRIVGKEEDGTDDYEYLEDLSKTVFKYVEDFVHKRNVECVITTGPPLLDCKGFGTVPSHKYLGFEKQACSMCRDVVCRHCCVARREDNVERTLCLGCYQKQKLVGSTDSDTKDRNILISEIQEEVYGGGYTFLSDCSMQEI